jgi:hypothetical protein
VTPDPARGGCGRSGGRLAGVERSLRGGTQVLRSLDLLLAGRRHALAAAHRARDDQRVVGVDPGAPPARKLDDEARPADQQAGAGYQQTQARAHRLRRRGHHGGEPQAAIDRGGHAGLAVVGGDDTGLRCPALAAHQRRELRLRGLRTGDDQQPFSV